jgi:DNA/RNA endonuclease YhcR with UshA esterase domain
MQFAVLLISLTCFGAEEPKVITPAEAAKHVNETVTVEMTVQSSRLLADRSICFLNSHKDFREEGNFAVVILREAIEAYKAAEVADPAAHFQGKKIRVTGKVTQRDDKLQIRVEATKQLVLVKEAK